MLRVVGDAVRASLCGLRRTAVIGMHAQSSFYAVAELAGLDVPHWDGLSALEQHAWFERSKVFLESLAPSPYFELAASLARSESAKILNFRDLDARALARITAGVDGQEP